MKDLQDLNYVTERSCGGEHTLTYPNVRPQYRNPLIREELEILGTQTQTNYQGVDILGHDGHIYRGQIERLPSLTSLEKVQSGSHVTGQDSSSAGGDLNGNKAGGNPTN